MSHFVNNGSPDKGPPTNKPSPASEFEELERRRASHRRWYFGKQPKQIGKVIAQLVQRKGYAQVRTADQREKAWQVAAGEMASFTQVGGLRRGVLEVLVANSLVMQELSFRKEDLLAQLQEALPETKIQQIRFRIGQIQ
jgi:predicted nucleic acid-binding Zn ribbon protein